MLVAAFTGLVTLAVYLPALRNGFVNFWDDRVTIILTRDTTVAIARGFSTHQTLNLQSDLIIPGQATFYWNGQGTVVDGGGQCGVNPGNPSFQ